MHSTAKLFLATMTVACAASLAFGAERTILGKSFTVKQNPASPATRKVVGVGREVSSPDPLVGDPTSAGGALLEVIALGGTPSSQSFSLPQGTSSAGKPFWSTSGPGTFRYRDPKGDNGPVRNALVRRTPKGTFGIKIKVTGKNGPVDIVPPDPGTSACFAITLAGGDRYSVQFGPESQIKNVDGRLFKARKPTAQGICPHLPPPSSTTSTTGVTIATTSTTSSTTTTTTIYGSASRAFLIPPADLLD